MNTFESSLPFSEFKTDQKGLVPCIVQDYRTSQVLMMAYMNEESYQMTCDTGKMTYYSRSRQQLWVKGEVSGHFQYVKELSLDCDNDTLLAKVHQIGAACHTGSYSCFFKELAKRDYNDTNPLTILEEDFATMLNAYRKGIIKEERMQEALTRILGLKAHMGLHKQAREKLVPQPEVLERTLGKDEYQEMQKTISRECITLVKYKDKDVLPLKPKRHKRIMIVHIKGAGGPMGEIMRMMGMPGGNNAAELLKEKLCEKGFDAFIYESPLQRMKKQVEEGEKPSLNLYFAGKHAISDFVKDMDLVITLCDVPAGRPAFGMSKGGGEIPWYVFEIPVIVIGCGQPTMLADIPQARTYINTYDAKESTFDALVDALMKGPGAFKGKDPIDSFCGLFDTHL